MAAARWPREHKESWHAEFVRLNRTLANDLEEWFPDLCRRWGIVAALVLAAAAFFVFGVVQALLVFLVVQLAVGAIVARIERAKDPYLRRSPTRKPDSIAPVPGSLWGDANLVLLYRGEDIPDGFMRRQSEFFLAVPPPDKGRVRDRTAGFERVGSWDAAATHRRQRSGMRRS